MSGPAGGASALDRWGGWTSTPQSGKITIPILLMLCVAVINVSDDNTVQFRLIGSDHERQRSRRRNNLQVTAAAISVLLRPRPVLDKEKRECYSVRLVSDKRCFCLFVGFARSNDIHG